MRWPRSEPPLTAQGHGARHRPQGRRRENPPSCSGAGPTKQWGPALGALPVLSMKNATGRSASFSLGHPGTRPAPSCSPWETWPHRATSQELRGVPCAPPPRHAPSSPLQRARSTPAWSGAPPQCPRTRRRQEKFNTIAERAKNTSRKPQERVTQRGHPGSCASAEGRRAKGCTPRPGARRPPRPRPRGVLGSQGPGVHRTSRDGKCSPPQSWLAPRHDTGMTSTGLRAGRPPSGLGGGPRHEHGLKPHPRAPGLRPPRCGSGAGAATWHHPGGFRCVRPDTGGR